MLNNLLLSFSRLVSYSMSLKHPPHTHTAASIHDVVFRSYDISTYLPRFLTCSYNPEDTAISISQLHNIEKHTIIVKIVILCVSRYVFTLKQHVCQRLPRSVPSVIVFLQFTEEVTYVRVTTTGCRGLYIRLFKRTQGWCVGSELPWKQLNHTSAGSLYVTNNHHFNHKH